jgi:hypothetical protein
MLLAVHAGVLAAKVSGVKHQDWEGYCVQRILTILMAGTATLAAVGAQAQVTGITGVVTGTAGVVTAGDGASIAPPVVYSGPQINVQQGDIDTGFGVTIAATSTITPGLIEFQNGSGTSGPYTFLTTETDVNITIRNVTSLAQTPTLDSQIIAAGLGLFVGGECLTTLSSCTELQTPYTFQSFAQAAQAGAAANGLLAGASVEFQILNGKQSLFNLNASSDLVYDASTASNVFVDNVTQAQTLLNGFQLQTPAGSQTAHGYNWDTTDLTLPLGVTLAPGQSTTVTYQTTTRSFSRSDCIALTACLIGYSAFGDPIGMSGGVNGVRADASAVFANPITGPTFETFDFAAPTYVDGVLTYVLAAPEPGAWSLLMAGFGLVGVTARRRRARTPLSAL